MTSRHPALLGLVVVGAIVFSFAMFFLGLLTVAHWVLS